MVVLALPPAVIPDAPIKLGAGFVALFASQLAAPAAGKEGQ